MIELKDKVGSSFERQTDNLQILARHIEVFDDRLTRIEQSVQSMAEYLNAYMRNK